MSRSGTPCNHPESCHPHHSVSLLTYTAFPLHLVFNSTIHRGLPFVPPWSRVPVPADNLFSCRCLAPGTPAPLPPIATSCLDAGQGRGRQYPRRPRDASSESRLGPPTSTASPSRRPLLPPAPWAQQALHYSVERGAAGLTPRRILYTRHTSFSSTRVTECTSQYAQLANLPSQANPLLAALLVRWRLKQSIPDAVRLSDSEAGT